MQAEQMPNPLANPSLPRLGLGCMGMSEFYGAANDQASLRALHAALEIGYRHYDTADMYGNGHNEELLGKFLKTVGASRNELVIASKVGIRREATNGFSIDSSPEYIRQACEASLRRLGVERIDLFYLHRRSRDVPIEESMGAMLELRRAGKVSALGLSEVSADTLRKAVCVAPVAALQSEYSLWTRDPELELFSACAELGVTFVAYSPLGRGFLSGELELEHLRQDGDLHALLPRFQPGAFQANANLLQTISQIAGEQGATRAQVALAWTLAKNPRLHAIPGTRSLLHLRHNFEAQNVQLSAEQLESMSITFRAEAIAGARYPEPLLRTVNT